MIAWFESLQTTGLWGIVGFFAALVASALYSGSETGVYAVNRLRLELRAERDGDRVAQRLRALLERRELVLCVLLIGNNIANEAASILGEEIVNGFVPSSAWSSVAASLLLTPLLFLTSEALPKQLFRARAETLTYRATGFLEFSRILFWPLTQLVLPVARWATRWASGRQSALRGFRHDEFALERLLVAGGETVEPVRETALGIGTRRQRPVREILVPIDQMRWLHETDGTCALRDQVRQTRHSRYPLRDGEGHFSSYVYFLDAFRGSGEVSTLASVARPLARLAASCPLDEALAELESAAAQVAHVEDAAGQTLGFVFAGDLIAKLLTMGDSREL